MSCDFLCNEPFLAALEVFRVVPIHLILRLQLKLVKLSLNIGQCTYCSFRLFKILTKSMYLCAVCHYLLHSLKSNSLGGSVRKLPHQVLYYLDEIRNLKDKIKRTKEKKVELQKCREKMIVDFDMDYKTIEKRLSKEFPEFVEKSTV